MAGNGCGHNVSRPRLRPSNPIRKGKGGLPRILSLAAERAKSWYHFPQKCHVLKSSTASGDRRTRSERREAYQLIIETMLSFLDLASLCLGTPTLDKGFVDISMKNLVATSGMSRRRCERAIADLKEAGLMEVKQPRKRNEHGTYIGLRAIRVITSQFFEFLRLGPMLQRERGRATAMLRRKAAQANRTLTQMMRRFGIGAGKPSPGARPEQSPCREKIAREWNLFASRYLQAGFDSLESIRRTNEKLGLPEDFRPSM